MSPNRFQQIYCVCIIDQAMYLVLKNTMVNKTDIYGSLCRVHSLEKRVSQIIPQIKCMAVFQVTVWVVEPICPKVIFSILVTSIKMDPTLQWSWGIDVCWTGPGEAETRACHALYARNTRTFPNGHFCSSPKVPLLCQPFSILFPLPLCIVKIPFSSHIQFASPLNKKKGKHNATMKLKVTDLLKHHFREMQKSSRLLTWSPVFKS